MERPQIVLLVKSAAEVVLIFSQNFIFQLILTTPFDVKDSIILLRMLL